MRLQRSKSRWNAWLMDPLVRRPRLCGCWPKCKVWQEEEFKAMSTIINMCCTMKLKNSDVWDEIKARSIALKTSMASDARF